MEWLIDLNVNDGYPYLADLGEPQKFDRANLFEEPVPYYLWVIRDRQNDGYPYFAYLGEPQKFDRPNLFEEPVPYYLWVIRDRRNDGYPFIHFQFSTPVITNKDYIKLQRQNQNKVITKIVSTYNFNGDDVTFQRGEGDEHSTLKISNPFMTNEIMNDLYKELYGLEYVPYTMQWRSYPYLEPGDQVIIETKKGELLRTYILQNKIIFKGGLRAETKAPASSQQQSEFKHKGTLTQKVENLQKTTLREGKDYYGVRTSREFGLKIKREDGASEVVLNSDRMEFLANGEKKLYFDIEDELYKFTGKIIASMFEGGTINIGNGTFEVEENGKVTMKSGDIVITRQDGKARVVISEASGMRFQKFNETTQEWEDTIALDANGEGVIIGGTIKTAKDGARIEISNNQIRSYNDSGELHGLSTNNSTEQFGDWEFFDNDTRVFVVYNKTLEQGVTLMADNGASLNIGSAGDVLVLEGYINMNGTITINGNTISSFESKTAGDTFGQTEKEMLQETHDKLKELLDAINDN